VLHTARIFGLHDGLVAEHQKPIADRRSRGRKHAEVDVIWLNNDNDAAQSGPYRRLDRSNGDAIPIGVSSPPKLGVQCCKVLVV